MPPPGSNRVKGHTQSLSLSASAKMAYSKNQTCDPTKSSFTKVNRRTGQNLKARKVGVSLTVEILGSLYSLSVSFMVFQLKFAFSDLNQAKKCMFVDIQMFSYNNKGFHPELRNMVCENNCSFFEITKEQ